MVLRPLEYSECVTDSPFFRETLQAHEKELESTGDAIKVLAKACKRLLTAQRGERGQNNDFRKFFIVVVKKFSLESFQV